MSEPTLGQVRQHDRVSTPLLTLITQQSLDEDYLHVAERKAAERAAAGGDGPRRSRPHRTAAVVVAAFGLLVTVAALQTSARAGVDDAGRASLVSRIDEGRAGVAELQRQIVKLRELNVGLQDNLDEVTTTEQAAQNRNVRLGAVSGFRAVTGPGVRVTVDDDPSGIPGGEVKDTDLRLLVNGLWRAGAEAISINGMRLTARSAIRNSGIVVRVNFQALSPPYVVSAIGDKDTLQGKLLDTASGRQFFDLPNQVGIVVDMDNVDQLSLPAAPSKLLRLRSAVQGTAQQKLNQPQKETEP
ncbi:MAG: hypothetical protein JWN91_3199 [Nocardioides sp.]|jgi:uncharacterized protein YlxW (UPF0749 family)|nr:hypothetical protein [Nocardioides sp.]